MSSHLISSMPRLLGRRRALALLAAPAFSSMARAEASTRMPDLDCRTLNGVAVRLLQSLPSARTMLFVSGRDQHAEDRERWTAGQGGPGSVPVAQVLMLQDYGWSGRVLLREEARLDADPLAIPRGNLLLAYGQRGLLARSLGIAVDDARLHVLVVQRADGLILAHEAGEAHARGSDRLEAALG